MAKLHVTAHDPFQAPTIILDQLNQIAILHNTLDISIDEARIRRQAETILCSFAWFEKNRNFNLMLMGSRRLDPPYKNR